MSPTQNPGTSEPPAGPQGDPGRIQPGQGDDFTKPGKKNVESGVGVKPADQPIEDQNLEQLDDNDELELEDND